jgi:hypothetical protein
MLEGLAMEDVGMGMCILLVYSTANCYVLLSFFMFYSHLLCFMPKWYTFWLFGIFFPFWYVAARKIWQPCFKVRND